MAFASYGLLAECCYRAATDHPIAKEDVRVSSGGDRCLVRVIAVVSDVHHFCERQPSACVTGSQTIVQFGDKVQTGAELLYRFLNERLTADQSTAPAKTTNKSLMREPSSSTLSPADLAAPWHGPTKSRV